MKGQAKVRHDVDAWGWHVMKVFAPDDSYPPFAYTIGLETTFDHPELVMFGLNEDLDFMHKVLNAIGARIRDGERFEHGARKRGLLHGYECRIARFPRSAYDAHLGQAIDYYGSSKFRAVQCVWPSPARRWPWDHRVDPVTLRRQPVFLRPDAGPRDPVWPFADSHSLRVLSTRQVTRGRLPVRFVGRFHRDGGWQLICDTTSDPADLVQTTLGMLYDRDPSLRAIAKLRPGEQARRTGARWRRGKMSPD